MTLEFRGHTIAKTGAWGQGPALLQTLGDPRRVRRRAARPVDRARRPHDPRGAEARLRRPRRVLRRRRRAARRPALPRVRGRAARTDRRLAPRRSSVRAPSAGREPVHPPLRTESGAVGGAGGGAGAHRRRDRRDARRHLPHRRRRPLGQHRLGHAVGRLAAVVADDPGARLLPRHAPADDLARGGVDRRRSRPGDGRARRSRRRSCCATASRSPRSARPAATSRTSGSCSTCCARSSAATRPQAGDRRAGAAHDRRSPDSFWPRTWEPAGAVVEDRLGDDVIAGLEARGHVVTRAGDWSLGRVSSVGRDPRPRCAVGARPTRAAMQGYAAGR